MTVFSAAIVALCLASESVTAFAPRRASFLSTARTGSLSARSGQRTRLFAEELEELDEADIEELETRKEGEILARKLRSNMYAIIINSTCQQA